MSLITTDCRGVPLTLLLIVYFINSMHRYDVSTFDVEYYLDEVFEKTILNGTMDVVGK